MSQYDDYISKLNTSSFSDYAPFTGVVEDNMDPMALGRVKARCFGFHPEDRTLVPTEHLPWSIVAQPTTSASISGVGWSPNGLELGTWVIGYFADGKNAQYPIITHTLPGIHRPNPPGVPGGDPSGYLNSDPRGAGTTDGSINEDTMRPYHNEVVEIPEVDDFGRPINRNANPKLAPAPNGTAFGDGATIGGGNANMMLTHQHKDQWESLGLKTYSWKTVPEGYGCRDGSLKFHYGTALAMEQLTKDFGKGKMELNSAWRSPAYNASVDGARNSLHMQGKALDVSFRTIGNSRAEQIKFAKLAVKNGFVGFGLYQTFMHIDTGSGRTWNGASASWFVEALKEAGWYPGKPGLEGVALNPGAQTEEQVADQPLGGTNVTGSTTEEYIRQDLASKGYTNEQIAAVLAHAKGESNLNPGALNPNDVGKPAYGLFQWRGDRLESLKEYSAANGMDYTTTQAQMAYFHHEMATNEKNAGGNLRNSKNLIEANKAMAGYERYRGWNTPGGAETQERLGYAGDFFSGSAGTLSAADPTKGFVDPTNSLPFPEYRGTPSTHVNARGLNSGIEQIAMNEKDVGRLTGFPAAGDVGTFGEPELLAAPQYPYNKTFGTKSGHLMEWDDSPGAERINIEHKTGSGIEIFADGQVSQRTVGNDFKMISGDSYQGVLGKYFLTSVNDMHVRSTGDMHQQADGSLFITMGNDGTWVISGDATISVGEDIKIKAGARIVIEGNGIDFLSHAGMNFESAEDMTFKSGGKMSSESGGDMGLKAPTVYIDDVVRMAEGGAPAVEGADSADVGAAPGRTEVAKDNGKTTTNSNRATTLEEATEYYSTQGTIA